MNLFSGGGASPFSTLNMRQASEKILQLLKVNKLIFWLCDIGGNSWAFDQVFLLFVCDSIGFKVV